MFLTPIRVALATVIVAFAACSAAPAPPGAATPAPTEPDMPPASGATAGDTPAGGPLPDGAAPPLAAPEQPGDVPGGSPRDVVGRADGGGAGGPDTRPAIGGPSSPCASLLCEDFESLPDGPYPAGRAWRAFAPSRMVVDSTRSARGKKALHITTPTSPSEQYLSETQTLAATGNAFYGRVFMYVGSAPTSFVHWNLVEAMGSDNKRAVRYGGILSGGARWMFNLETHGIGERAIDNGGRVPLRQWLCVEWFYDAGRNDARLWVDGVENVKEHYQGTFGSQFGFLPPWRSVRVGWALYQTINAPFDVWIDELAIDSKRIGC